MTEGFPSRFSEVNNFIHQYLIQPQWHCRNQGSHEALCGLDFEGGDEAEHLAEPFNPDHGTLRPCEVSPLY